MYSVVAHQNYGRDGRRNTGRQPQSQQQTQQSLAQEGTVSDVKEGATTCRKRHHHRPRLSFTARLLNYIRRRFNREQGKSNFASAKLWRFLLFLCRSSRILNFPNPDLIFFPLLFKTLGHHRLREKEHFTNIGGHVWIYLFLFQIYVWKI